MSVLFPNVRSRACFRISACWSVAPEDISEDAGAGGTMEVSGSEYEVAAVTAVDVTGVDANGG